MRLLLLLGQLCLELSLLLLGRSLDFVQLLVFQSELLLEFHKNLSRAVLCRVNLDFLLARAPQLLLKHFLHALQLGDLRFVAGAHIREFISVLGEHRRHLLLHILQLALELVDFIDARFGDFIDLARVFLFDLRLLEQQLLNPVVLVNQLLAQEVHILMASLASFNVILQLQTDHLLGLELLL